MPNERVVLPTSPPPSAWTGKYDEHPWLVFLLRAGDEWRVDNDDARYLEIAWAVGEAFLTDCAAHIGLPSEADEDILRTGERLEHIIQEQREAFPQAATAGSLRYAISSIREGMHWVKQFRTSQDAEALLAEIRKQHPRVAYGRRIALWVALKIHNGAAPLVHAMQEPPKVPEIRVDWVKGFELIERVLSHELPPAESMERALDALHELKPMKRWDRFRTLPYDDEIDERRSFLVELTNAHPPVSSLTGFWFGISYPLRGGYETLDTYVGGSDSYDPTDDEFGTSLNWEPPNPFLESQLLKAIHDVGHRKKPLFSQGSDLVGLAYTCIVARELARSFKQANGTSRVGACCGFDGGDHIHLGWL